MALSIVADTRSAPHSLPGITQSSRWSCDIYGGTAEALIAARLITREQLEPQKGRQPGVTAFLAHGEPCPPHLRAWREPGYKVIRQQDDGTFSVEITASKEVQQWRRRAENAAKYEAEQERTNREVAETGHEYRNWAFKQDFGGCAEIWEGTKTQLQAAGLGGGLKFPGEPGATKEVLCKCPLGFEFVIRLPDYDRAKREARIYTAHSWYDSRKLSKEFETYAPGVLREVWTAECYGVRSDTYEGSADALVDAGLVPSVHYFPGQPGVNKTQASYLKNWRHTTTASGQDWGATIRKRGNSGRFSVEVPVGKQEFDRRNALSKARDEARKRNELRLSAERKQLRQGADQTEKSADEFRAERARLAELYIEVLWSEVFAKGDGALKFDIPEDSEWWEELAGAFQSIRDAAQEADILRDRQQVLAAQTRLKLLAARRDQGLQSLLQNVKHLRLVETPPKE